MKPVVPASPPVSAFRAEVEARLGRAASGAELDVLMSLFRGAWDAEALDVDEALPPLLGRRGEVHLAFGKTLPEAWARLRALDAIPAALEAWGPEAFREEAEAFALGAGLPMGTRAEGAANSGALALGFRSSPPHSPAPGARLLRLEGAAIEALALGSQARGLAEARLAPGDPAELVAWVRALGRGLRVDVEFPAGPWGYAVVDPHGVASLQGRLGAWGLRASEAGHLTEDGVVAIHRAGQAELELPREVEAPSEGPAPAPEVLPPAPCLPLDLPEEGVEIWFHALRPEGSPEPEVHWRPLGEDGDLALRVAFSAGLEALDPFWGAATLVAHAAQGLACAGAEALGLALALPEDADAPTLMGLRQACASLDLPVVRVQRLPGLEAPLAVAFGCVEAGAGPVDVDAPEARGLTAGGPRIAGIAYRRAFDGLFLMGESRGELGGSRYLATRGGADLCPEPWLDEAFRLQACVREGVRLGLFRSAHTVGAGGLLVAALEGARASRLGCQLLLTRGSLRLDALCFGEAPGRVLVTTNGEGESALRTLARTHRIPFAKVGVVGGERFTVAVDGVPVVDASLDELELRSRG